ncbi:hypothetical protein M413DRAFT_71629 [Hebeloma cylindrosporum]|uniref:Uncharacterized protein n=1 Tax=Hebeloma cylindrosporum TaxID=76867 RepID=A0A0C3CD08_HEBCY|nr:hypothetical protein M413DRAFT_71629 [Hebeloma cylindrosporum h7]
MYGELSVADVAEEFAPVRTRLQQEWIFDAGFVSQFIVICLGRFPSDSLFDRDVKLVALSSANAAVFAVSPDSVFKINSHAYTAIATSSAACGLGIACDVWFLLRYNWVDLDTFIYRSRDVYDSYAFFSISSRMPTLCMLLSAISLMAFLGLVAYDAWPRGVLVIGLLALLLMLLQFIVYGMHRFSASALTTGRHLMGKVGQSFWSSTNGHRGQV